MAKKLIIIFITLTAVEFYNLAFLGPNFAKILQVAGIGLLLGILIIQTVYQKQIDFPKNFSWGVFLIFLGVALSMLMAKAGHDQAFQITLIAQRFMYYYIAYWVLHSIKFSIEDLERIILWMGITFSILYIIQFIVYPTVVFDVRIAEDRGTVRIFLSGFLFLSIAYFLTLSKIFREFSFFRLFSLTLFLSIFILMGTRQIIFSILLLTIMYVLFSKAVKSRVIILFLMGIATIPILVLFQDIFLSLLDLSKSQSETIAENVRLRAAVFFLTEFFPNNLAYITGNGADSTNSYYGFMVQMYKDAYGFYQSDIGLVGDYTKFGAAFVIGAFYILFKIIFGRLSPNNSYIRYLFLSIILTLFTGGGPFAQSDSIIAICFLMYILDVDKYDRDVLEYEKLNAEEEEEETLILTTQTR